MPINKDLMKSMRKTYGSSKRTEKVYFALENKMKKEDPKKAKRVFKIKK